MGCVQGCAEAAEQDELSQDHYSSLGLISVSHQQLSSHSQHLFSVVHKNMHHDNIP